MFRRAAVGRLRGCSISPMKLTTWLTPHRVPEWRELSALGCRGEEIVWPLRILVVPKIASVTRGTLRGSHCENLYRNDRYENETGLFVSDLLGRKHPDETASRPRKINQTRRALPRPTRGACGTRKGTATCKTLELSLIGGADGGSIDTRPGLTSIPMPTAGLTSFGCGYMEYICTIRM